MNNYECKKEKCMFQWISNKVFELQECPKCKSKAVVVGHHNFIDTSVNSEVYRSK